ncbi:hypothetical protein C0991_001534, partial [Blastosporella zonata]
MTSTPPLPLRPPTITFLAARALADYWDPAKELKHYLRMAERLRRDAETFLDEDPPKYDEAFILYARAATLVMERLPEHRDYEKTLNKDQRANLNANGQSMMARMAEIKPILLKRIAEWDAMYSGHQPAPAQPQPTQPDSPQTPRPSNSTPASTQPPNHSLTPLTPTSLTPTQSTSAPTSTQPQSQVRFGTISVLPSPSEHRRAVRAQAKIDFSDPVVRAQEEERARKQEEFRLREEEIRRKKAAEKRAQQERAQALAPQQELTPQVGDRDGEREKGEKRQVEKQRERDDREREIGRRQEEADERARNVRKVIEANNPGVNLGAGAYQPPPPQSQSQSQQQQRRPRKPSEDGELVRYQEPIRLPLESPVTWYDPGDTTDPDSPNRTHPRRQIEYPTPARSTGTNPTALPLAITTGAFLPPAQARIQYPQLMTQHQLKQGYQPASDPTPAPPIPGFSSNAPPSFPAYQTPNGTRISRTSELYPNHLLARPMPVPPAGPSGYGAYTAPSRPAPPVPVPPVSSQHPLAQPPLTLQQLSRTQSQNRTQQPQSSGQSSSTDIGARRINGLRQVTLPRECLSRFIAIAASNTARNLETCGLLLGKETQKADNDSRYHVTTLLIPKQHATSDTCMMEGEEGVLEFTEERGLITLGWIHTHPTQSCFMSSVDLHTHAGFQTMLPESFAVVCAPKSTPNFGIFRLTAPPGLGIVLSCQAKEAFHPHPDAPIYT